MKRTVLALVAALSCNLAFAEEPVSYVSASVGSAKQKVSIQGFNMSQNNTAFQIAGGYFFAHNVGVEAGYTYLGKAEISGNGARAWSKPQTVHLAVIGAFNLSPQFAVTGKLGAANNYTKAGSTVFGLSDSDTVIDTTLMFGVGANYAFTPAVSAFVEYQNFGKIAKADGIDLKASFVSVGLRYNF